MGVYTHKVQYYETDMMGVAHHANYIHWMEEARVDFMDRLGFPYAKMEADDILSPVRSVSCVYKRPCTFGDEVSVAVSVAGFTGALLTVAYEMRKQDGELVCEARSEHVFVNRAGRIVRLRSAYPEFCRALEAQLQASE